MSLSSSLNNALSGLNAASRTASVVSSNVANSTTEGYAAREIDLSARVIGQVGAGVAVVGVNRIVDEQLLQDRRLADAAFGEAEVVGDFYSTVEDLIGVPDDVGSLSSTISGLETALISASSSPESEVRLQAVVDAAQGLASTLGNISDGIQSQRLQADSSIASQVTVLNDRLAQLDELNEVFVKLTSSGEDTNAIADQRQVLIDEISSIVPVQVHERSHDQVALYTSGGVKLLDGTAAEIEFTSVGTIVPEMSLDAGSLSGLTFDGRNVDMSSTSATVSGGTLSALFQVRDELAVDAQTDIDAVARDLLERFSDTAVDGSDVGGLFTDAGSTFDTADEVGLSQRLAIDTRVDPAEGGELSKLRDGLGALAQGDVGNATILIAMTDALTNATTTASGSYAGASNSALALASDLLSGISTDRQSSEANISFSSALLQGLETQELENGVDTDQELQTLLLVEQAFTANAKVMQTIDELIGQLLEL